MNFLTTPKPELGLRRLASAPLSKLPDPSPRRFPVRQRFRNGTNLRGLPRKKSELRCEADGSDRASNGVLEKAASGFAAAAAAAAVMAVCGCDAPALAESLTVAFPVSRAREASVNTVQRTLVEAWGLIRETFIDPTFNHQVGFETCLTRSCTDTDWDLKLQQTMVEMFPLKSADAAYNKISGMLATLGDPFTRIISPKVVLSCIEGSPADRAGIHEGDELIEIDGKCDYRIRCNLVDLIKHQFVLVLGENLAGLDSEAAARKLRGRVGTTVRVKLHSGGAKSGIDNGLREVLVPSIISVDKSFT
ncbi:hypothetical protein BHE74_00054503 [Ensete ventricosum]|nr:hypothetical protein BHE74_00054503 [Ensete ventricosum]